MKLTEIIGLTQKHSDLLEKAGIRETEDLLPLTYYQIQQMARTIRVSVKTLDTWQEHADLMRIEGVTPQLANAINLIGIDSVKEFARRNAKTTVAKLKELKSEKPKILTKVPTEKEVQKWKDQAITLEGTPSKKPSTPKTPAKTPAKTPSDSSELPIQPKLVEIKPFDTDYGEFGPEYWNKKWEEAPIIYTGRALRGKSYEKQIDADVKVFIKQNDAILHHVISQLDLYKNTANQTAWTIQKFVCNFLKYTDDDVTVDCPEYWLFPFESIQSEVGDCIANYEEIYTEDGIKTVGELKVGEKVLSYDFENKKFCYKPITKIWEKGKLDINRVLFRNGQSIDVSENHPFWIRQTQKECIYEKIYLSKIELSKWWKRKTPIAKKIPYKIIDIEWLTEDLCLVLGHYLAEGWKEKSGKVRSSGYELLDEIIPIFEKHEIPYSEYTNSSGVPCVTILKSDFKNFLRTTKENSFNITIPEKIFHLPPNKLQAILNGFYLGDGHWGKYPDKRGFQSNKQEVLSTSSEELARDIQRIGLQLGKSYHIWKQVNHKGLGKKPIYRITFNPESHFLKDYGYQDLSEVSIREYSKFGSIDMRDFEVADTNSYVFKNGIIGHNCEDGAILIASLLVNAGIPAWRVKVCAAQVMADPIVAPADDEGELGGHAYCIYLADRPESERKLEWVILDWCYMQDPEIPVEKKPLARDGGQEGAYRNIWFSFNNEKSWAQTAFEVTSRRISNHQTSKMKDVLGELQEITRILAEEEIDKLLEKLNFTVE